MAASIQGEKDAWQSAMKELRPDFGMNARGSMLPWYSMERMNLRPDLAGQHRARVLEMLPWGMSTRVTLSREAALTAAAIGDGSKKIGHALVRARGDMASLAGEIGGAAGFGSLARFFGSPLTMAAVAVGLAGENSFPTRRRIPGWPAKSAGWPGVPAKLSPIPRNSPMPVSTRKTWAVFNAPSTNRTPTNRRHLPRSD